MTANRVSEILIADKVTNTDDARVAHQLPGLASNLSFALEWKTHIEEGQQISWDYTAA